MFSKKKEEFDKFILTKFNIYNGLFLNLPYDQEAGVGALIPLLNKYVENGLKKDQTPQEILDGFFNENQHINDEQEKLDFMFKVVQFIERQIVLFDSIEDATFPEISSTSNRPGIGSFLKGEQDENKREKALAQLKKLSTRIVLTAHPTQFYQPAVLNIIADLGEYIRENKLDKINESLQQLGLTSLLNSKKPTPLDEAKNIIYYLRNVFYDAIGELFFQVKNEVELFEEFDNYDITKLGFWPGGDRDGNPFVTADVTADVIDELRTTLMKCYYNDVKELQKKITFKHLDEDFADLRELFYKAMFNPEFVISYSEVLLTLESIKDSLIKDYHSLFLPDFERFMVKFKIFKTHFATLDIRQDHSVHYALFTNLLKNAGTIKESLTELGEDELIAFLTTESIELDPASISDPVQADTLKNVLQIPHLQELNGREGCERYIISNSEDTSAVLFVLALLRNSVESNEEIHMDIVPLFETMDGMNNSEAVMRKLFELPAYREHVRRRGDEQTIMLGYSDGTKDGGFLQANWNIFKTKEVLSQVCEEYGVKVMFFDGRGGPPARGGGKTHRFYAAQSDLIANHEIQLTIQGQTISSTYGTHDQFIYNCKELITASLTNAVYGEQNFISKKHRELLEALAQNSFIKYSQLKEHPKFLEYLTQKSTLKYYSNANIGSRPAKRRGDKKLTLSDLRAISFVGSWSQLKQNVPGYYGFGSTLAGYLENGQMSDIKELFKQVPIFKALALTVLAGIEKRV